MKKISKILMLLLVAMLAMAIGVTALATEEKTTEKKGETHTISVAPTDVHTYDVYQILVGDLYGKTLSNIEWGSSVNPDDEGKVNGMTAAQFAESLEGKTGTDVVAAVAAVVNGNKVKAIDKDHPAKDMATGYYVMIDSTNPLERTEERSGEKVKVSDTQALNVIQLVHDVTVTVKWGTTEDKKTIVADTLGEGSEEKTLEDGAKTDNVSVGDTVKYQIETKVPDNAKQFKEGTFFFVITDKLSEGLTFTEGSIKVTANGTTLKAGTNYTVRYPEGADSNTFEIGLINARDYESQTIVVTYSAVLNEKAKIGETGNENKSHVEFSNNPNKTYDGTVEKTDEKGFPDSTKNVPTGKTPDSETKTYTTGIEIQKVDENGNVLTGAAFTIEGESTQIVLVSEETFTKADDGTYYKLTNGTYTTQAPIATPFMKKIGTVVEGSKGYVVDESATGEDVKVMGGITYRPVNATGDGGKDLYILSESNTDEYEKDTETSDYTKYKKTIVYNQQNTTGGTTSVTASVGPDGVVTFNGLGAGTYTIKESKTPDGYNTIPDFEIKIDFTADPKTGEHHWDKKSTSGNYTYDATSGVYKTTIVNNKGGELPETGGIGTTIFYIGGSILVLAALILLVTRRRMSAND